MKTRQQLDFTEIQSEWTDSVFTLHPGYVISQLRTRRYLQVFLLLHNFFLNMPELYPALGAAFCQKKIICLGIWGDCFCFPGRLILKYAIKILRLSAHRMWARRVCCFSQKILISKSKAALLWFDSVALKDKSSIFWGSNSYAKWYGSVQGLVADLQALSASVIT